MTTDPHWRADLFAEDVLNVPFFWPEMALAPWINPEKKKNAAIGLAAMLANRERMPFTIATRGFSS